MSLGIFIHLEDLTLISRRPHLLLDPMSNRGQTIIEFTEENLLKMFSEVMFYSYNRVI